MAKVKSDDKEKSFFLKRQKREIFALSIVVLSYVVYKLFLSNDYSPIVKTKEGDLIGIVENSRLGKSYYEFPGIPYALPPEDELRFEVRI